MKYQKKPVVIEAFQYDGDLKGTDGKYYVPGWAVEAYEKGIMHYGALKLDDPPCELFIDTLEGTHHVSVGDYVIKGIKGELYPCKPDIFEDSYEPVNWHFPARRKESMDKSKDKFLTFCNECGWEEKTIGLPYHFCPKCGHVNIGFIHLKNVRDDKTKRVHK